MKKVSLALIALMALIVLGCGSEPTHESVAMEGITAMEALFAELENVSDEASAEKALPAIEKIGKKLEGLKAQMEALGKPSPEVEAELKKKMEGRMKALMPKMMALGMKMGTLPKETKEKIEAVMKKAM